MSSVKSQVLNNSVGWSRSLRYSNYSSSDSDSDTKPPGRQSALGSSESTLSEDARLVRDLDLSSRRDDAVFKPNPWSIAKVNAAARSREPSRTNSLATKAPPRRQPGIQLAEAFKVQAQRPRFDADSRLRPLESAPVTVSSLSSSPKVSKAQSISQTVFGPEQSSARSASSEASAAQARIDPALGSLCIYSTASQPGCLAISERVPDKACTTYNTSAGYIVHSPASPRYTERRCNIDSPRQAPPILNTCSPMPLEAQNPCTSHFPHVVARHSGSC